jgi:hypothetical protein
MSHQRKLELMKKYDFHGMGNIRATIRTLLCLLSLNNPSKEKENGYFKRIEEQFARIHDLYSNINFEELKAEGYENDDDFATLFKTREILQRTRQSMNELERYVENHQYNAQRNTEPPQNTDLLVLELMKADRHQGVPYRMRIDRLEGNWKEPLELGILG